MMPLTGLSREQIDYLESSLLEKIPAVGSVGNTALLRNLRSENQNWTDDLYWAIRNRLIDGGQLGRGRGQGGSVRRVPTILADISTDEQPIAQQTNAERNLYEPMLTVIKQNWSPDHGLDIVIAEITAQGGRRPDGKWSRPDVTLASYKTYPYVPGRHFDLITFEIKPVDGLDVTVVYEALAHRRAATRAYALLHVPSDRWSALEEIVDEICLEAKRVGIGVIIAEKAEDYQTWEELVEATRHEPDPQRLNDFLAKQVSQGFREQFIAWFR